MAPTISETVWMEIARAVPATLAFLLIAGFMVSAFIKAQKELNQAHIKATQESTQQFVATNKEITGSWMEFLERKDQCTQEALQDVAKSLTNMGETIVRRIDKHDADVQQKVLNAIHEEIALTFQGPAPDGRIKTKISKRNKAPREMEPT